MTKIEGDTGKRLLAELGLVDPVEKKKRADLRDIRPSDPQHEPPPLLVEPVTTHPKDKEKTDIRDAPANQIGHGEQYD